MTKSLYADRHNRLTFVCTVTTQFQSSDYSHGWLLFWFAKEYIRTKETRHTNDKYELFTHAHTSKCVVTFVLHYAAGS